jgi:hypothetical protein
VQKYEESVKETEKILIINRQQEALLQMKPWRLGQRY